MIELGLRQDWDRLVGRHSVAPRLGVAWSPPGLETTKIAAGFGVIYEASNLRLFSRPLDQYSLTTSYDRAGQPIRGPAVSIFQIEPAPSARPCYHNWNLGFEQRLPGGVYLRTGYLRRRGRDGFTYENILTHGEAPPPELREAFHGAPFDAVYRLSNLRRDVFDSFEITAQHSFKQQYAWMMSYIRSRAFSNAVVDLSVDDPIIITRNVGRMPWDAPNRFLSWGYLPLGRRNWALAYLLEVRDGYPFSIQDDEGRLVGQLNERRFPTYFELNVHLERRFFFKGYRWALRAGFNNITNHRNYDTVNNNTGSPNFLRFYGGQGRSMNFRLRWLGRN